MQFRTPSVAVLALALAAAACTTGGTSAPTAAPTTTAAPAPGPLVVDPDRPDGSGPLPTATVYRIGVGADGTPAVVFQDPAVEDSLTATRIGVGADPADWSPAAPADVESGNAVGELSVGPDGSVTALAVLNGAQAFGLHVLRVGPDGAVTETPVPDARTRTFSYRTVDAVSDDGATAVVASTDPATADPAAVDQVTVLTVDLATATVTGRGVADLGTDLPPDLLDVGVGPDGAVTVLTGRAPDAAEVDGAELVRFSPGLQSSGTVVLDAGARSGTAHLDLAPDGTAVVSLQPPSTSGQLATRVVTVAPGSTEVTPVADLDSIAVDELQAGPAGWVHLIATDYATSSPPELLPLDLDTGRAADPVELCDGAQPFGLSRSADGARLLAWVACGQADTRLFVLQDS